jgi:hypothetical protein
MRVNIAQWTGMAVTLIVVLESNMDVLHALPLGLFAEVLATYFAGFAKHVEEVAKHTTTKVRAQFRR